MPIKSGNHASAVVLSTDTTVLHPTTGRVVITAAVLSQTTGASETVDLFISSDATSAAAERLCQIILAANENPVIDELIGMSIPDGYYLIANGVTGSISTIFVTYTQYTGSS